MASAELDFAKPILIPAQARGWSLERMQFSVRLGNVLGNLGCEHLGDIHGLTYEQIGEAKSCGQKTLNELQTFVEQLYNSKLIAPTHSNHDDGKKRRGLTQLVVPQHARGWRTQRLQMSVRLANVLERMDVRLLGDLHGVSLEKVRATKNCGWQTVEELEGIIHRAQTGELSDIEAANSDTPAPINLVRIIDKALDEMPARSREFLLLYMGAMGAAAPLTLEEVGARYKVTRERVRQVMKKAIGQISKGGVSVAGELSEGIAKGCIAAVHPLTPELLAEWLGAEQIAACRYTLPFYIRLIEKLAPSVPAWPEGQTSSGLIAGRQADIGRHLKTILGDDAAPLSLDAALARLITIEAFANLEAREFLEALQPNASLAVEFSPPNKFEIRLAKLKTRDWVRRVLSQAERPLTPEEMIERGRQMFGDHFLPVTPFTLANVLRPEDGFYLLDRRAYGLRHHMRLPQKL